MSRLAAAGELLRVHHGLYWKGVQTRFGAGRPGLVDVAIAVAGPVPSFEGVRFHKRNNLARRDLSFWEIALLEALRSYPAYAEVSVAEFAARVRALVAEGKVRLTELEVVLT
jgi:hypothetical protein